MTETSPFEWLADETIFRRTRAGQREVIFDQMRIRGQARRLLMMVNGYTQLRGLLDLQPGAEDAVPAIQSLLETKLIEVVER